MPTVKLLSLTALLLTLTGIASAQTVIADFDRAGLDLISVDDGVESRDVDIDSDGDNERVIVDADGGFQTVMSIPVPRSGTLLEQMMQRRVWSWQAQGEAANNPGNFLNNHLAINTNVRDTDDIDGDGDRSEPIGFRVLEGMAQSYTANRDFDTRYEKDLGDSPDGGALRSALQRWSGGEGQYFQIIVVQQTAPGARSEMAYDDFTLSGDPLEASEAAAPRTGPALDDDSPLPPGYVWWEAETPVDTNFPPVAQNPFGPQGSEQADILSRGAWIGVSGQRNQPLFLEYRVEVPDAASYQFFVRKFWHHGPYRYRWNDGEWVEPGRVALLDEASMRTHVGANWTHAGEVDLDAGTHTLRIELLENDGAAAFDAFVLASQPFEPAGRLRPGQRLNRAEDGWFAWEPGSWPEGAESPIDLSHLNEDQAGEHGFIRAEGVDFVHADTGEAVRFWAVNIGPGVARLDDASMRRLAAYLARHGVNLVRYHGLIGENRDLAEVDAELLERVHFMIGAMRDEGIYTGLSMYFPLWVRIPEGDEVQGYAGDQRPHGLLMFDERYEQRYRDYLHEILTAENPYTGTPMAEDPAVAYLEIQNEDSVFFWTFNPYRNLPEPLMQRIERQFGHWLAEQHGSIQQAMQRYNNERVRGDAPGDGRVGLLPPWNLVNQQDRPRSQDQAAFLTDAQRAFYDRMTEFVRDEVGFGGMVTASNWKTASNQVLGPLEYYTYAAGDFVDHHGYYGGPHEGDGSSYSLRRGHRYADRAAVRLDDQDADTPDGKSFGHPMFIPVWNQMPSTISEYNHPMPNRYRADMPVFAAVYGAMHGVDSVMHFATGGPGWDRTHGKFPIQSPVIFGQFPATALIYRTGMIDEADPVATVNLDLQDMVDLRGMPVRHEQNLDQLRAADVPEGGEQQIDDLDAIDPLAALVGQLHINVTPGNDQPSTVTDLSPYIDRDAMTVRSVNGQVHLDYGLGLLRLATPMAQGAVGFLEDAGEQTFEDLAITSPMHYASVLLVAMDDQPLAQSERMLLQVVTEDQNYGWRTTGGDDGGMRTITDMGAAPIQVREVAGTVRLLSGADDATITALDQNGLPTDDVQRGAEITLRPDVLYYLVER
jgi:hypothetical protein